MLSGDGRAVQSIPDRERSGSGVTLVKKSYHGPQIAPNINLFGGQCMIYLLLVRLSDEIPQSSKQIREPGEKNETNPR